MSSPSFSGPDDFWLFEKEVTSQSRYIRSSQASAFLDAAVSTSRQRLRTIDSGSIFWRAQIGHRWTDNAAAGKRIPLPHPEARMKPWDDRAVEGRLNPKGIPCLYFATNREAAMSEVRPGIGSILSVARFKTLRDLILIDCSLFTEPFRSDGTVLAPDQVERAVWSHIDYAFSRPVIRSENTAGYAATQVLAEAFKTEGHDGVIYRTAFSEEGHNIALFDLSCADFIDASLFKVSKVHFEFEVAP